jgi:uncharacterized protein with PIN domain
MLPTIAVWFRLYGQLNDFVMPLRRQRSFRHEVAASATIKDTIEAIGVPHPEVDLIVVNGAAVDFAYRLREGDRVSVYPRFRAIDLAGAGRVGIAPALPIRFVIDVHLGKLASLLRLAGFDALVVNEDDVAAEVSAREGRVLLTRDVGLLKRSVVASGYWVRAANPERQFIEAIDRFDLLEGMAPFTRCLRCNTPLVAAAASEVSARILPRTKELFADFRECPGCGRVYWRGSHYERLVALLERARAHIRALQSG